MFNAKLIRQLKQRKNNRKLVNNTIDIVRFIKNDTTTLAYLHQTCQWKTPLNSV